VYLSTNLQQIAAISCHTLCFCDVREEEAGCDRVQDGPCSLLPLSLSLPFPYIEEVLQCVMNIAQVR